MPHLLAFIDQDYDDVTKVELWESPFSMEEIRQKLVFRTQAMQKHLWKTFGKESLRMKELASTAVRREDFETAHKAYVEAHTTYHQRLDPVVAALEGTWGVMEADYLRSIGCVKKGDLPFYTMGIHVETLSVWKRS
jgi:hypothetical protein